MIDLETFDMTIKERDTVKSYCRSLIVLNKKDTKVIHDQEKEIERLTKTQDPKILKMHADLVAKAKAGMGMRDIEEYMSERKKN